MRYYQSVHTGKVFSERQLSIVDSIFWEGYTKDLVDMEFLKEVDPPNVIDVLKERGPIAGTVLYRDLHDCTTREAMKMTRKIWEDIIRYQKKEEDRAE